MSVGIGFHSVAVLFPLFFPGRSDFVNKTLILISFHALHYSCACWIYGHWRAWAWVSIDKDGYFGAIQLKVIEWNWQTATNRMLICFSLLSINKMVCIQMARSLQILRGIFYLQPFNTHSNAMEEKNMTTANVEREKKTGIKRIEFAFAVRCELMILYRCNKSRCER